MSTDNVLVSGGGGSSNSGSVGGGFVSVGGGSVSAGGSSSAGAGSSSASAGAGSSVATGLDYGLEDYKDLETFKEEHIGGDYLEEYDAYTDSDYSDKGGKVLPAVIYEDLKEVHRVQKWECSGGKR